MQVYHKDLLENEAMISNAKSLFTKKFISKEQLNEIFGKLDKSRRIPVVLLSGAILGACRCGVSRTASITVE